ncbi:MAG TPA: GspE/PulE family protein [Gaiellaceae bacterium]|nr:GspE/PulE family protein [Gaiellaceae bacterium]
MTATAPATAELARARGLAQRSQLPWVDLDAETIDPRAVARLPFELMARNLAVPIGFSGETVRVAIADPAACDLVAREIPASLEFVVAPRDSLMHLLDSLRQTQRTRTLVALPAGEVGPELEMALLTGAAEAGTTDLHYVPTELGLSVRARIDGLLREIGLIPGADAAGAVARLKVKSQLDITEHRRAQEGRMRIATSSGREFDIRLTVIPTIAGEGAALRLLEHTARPPSLTEVGLSADLQLQLERLVNRRRGALLVTGPTGSGKSTTIYAALNDIADPSLDIVTVEDPVEYRFDGVYQVEVNPAIGVTFESTLRTFLRTDPDVIAVGEMRDLDTAAMTLKAALAGTFVLSTLHTYDAPGAITRLLDIGVEPYVTAATLTAVLAQRLVRRLCIYCRVRRPATTLERAELGLDDGEHHLFSATGCPHCDRGYRGQLAVHQLMTMTDELRQLALERAGHAQLRDVALSQGMRSLLDDGVAKALAGLTTLDELKRVVSVEDAATMAT